MAITINYVWVGDSQLDPVSKFNIYCWRALGHSVNIFTYCFKTGEGHTHETLGLEDVVTIYNLMELLNDDNEAGVPMECLMNTRMVLVSWLRAATGKEFVRDRTYNIVDVTKSYIGGTRCGIVLDLKVGPSEHVAAYEDVMCEKFVSYTRGSTPLVENQCMGTMAKKDDLRCQYGRAFETNFSKPNPYLDKPDEKWFDNITRFHGRAWEATDPHINVVKEPPNSKYDIHEYKVTDIDGRNEGRGPFRLFKKSYDQTNKNMSSGTKDHAVQFLCQDVMDIKRFRHMVFPDNDYTKLARNVAKNWE